MLKAQDCVLCVCGLDFGTHVVHACRCGSAFEVAVVSQQFDGKSLIQRHRLVREIRIRIAYLGLRLLYMLQHTCQAAACLAAHTSACRPDSGSHVIG